MKKLVEGFEHQQGAHCGTTTFKDLLAFYGFQFSEPMIFGLASGLWFYYWERKKPPYPFIVGRTVDLEWTLCANLGIALMEYTSPDSQAAWLAVKELNDNNIPIWINCDMHYLDHHAQSPHFGGHRVIVAGYDEEQGVAYLADNAFPALQPCRLESLKEARASKHGPFLSENAWFTLRCPTALPPLEVMIKRGAQKTAITMLNPPNENSGLPGIRRFGRELAAWDKQYPPAQFPRAYEAVYQMIEEIGTGGACFRNLWTGFLQGAIEHLDAHRRNAFASAAQIYTQTAMLWERVARLIRQATQDDVGGKLLREASQVLGQIADQEEQALTSLLDGSLPDPPNLATSPAARPSFGCTLRRFHERD